MVEDLSHLNAVFPASGNIARDRLKTLKGRQGYYFPAPGLMFGTDTVSLRSVKPDATPAPIETAKPRFKFSNPLRDLSPVRVAAQVGGLLAISVLGGIIGGGILGAILAGAGAAGLMIGQRLANSETSNRALDNLLQLKLPRGFSAASADNASSVVDAANGSDMSADDAAPVSANAFAAELKKSEKNDTVVSADADGSVDDSAAEQARDRLRTAILGAAMQTAAQRPEVNAFAAAFARKAVASGESVAATDGAGGFEAASARLRLVHPESVKFSARLRRLSSGNHRLLESIPVHNLSEPIGLVLITRDQARLLLVSPESGQPNEIRRSLKLGRGFNADRKTVTDIALRNMQGVLVDLKDVMADHDIHPENLRVVMSDDWQGMRDRQGNLVSERLSEALDLPMDVLSLEDKTGALYGSVMRGQGRRHPHQQNLVVGVERDRVNFALGKGQRSADAALNRKGELVLGDDLLEDAFSPIDTAVARERIRSEFDAQFGAEWLESARGRQAYIERDDLYQLLAGIEKSREGGGKKLMRHGLDRETMDWYLSPEGLSFLARQEYSEDGRSLNPLVERLLVLRETADKLGIERFRFGSPGGTTAGLIDELARRQIHERMEGLAGELHGRYQSDFPIVKQMMGRILPEFADQLHGRPKDPASTTDKLERKATRTGLAATVVHDVDDAEGLIGDGHGMSLVLDATSRENMEKIRDHLIRSVKAGEMRVVEINNFRGDGEDALPYLTESDVERIRMAAEARRMMTHPNDRPPAVKVVDGPARMKPAGYTTTKMNIRLRNPQTGKFDLSPCEFQLRGREVNDFSEVEHLVYDIRQGKNLYKNEAVRQRFSSEVAPLLRAIRRMSEAEFEVFTNYLSDYYLFSRRLEQGQVVPEPQKPAGLPEVCEVESLKRLSRLHRQLLERHYAPQPVNA